MKIHDFELLVKTYLWFNTNKHRFFGVKIGKGSNIYKNVHIDHNNGKIIIGKNVNISRRSVVMSHFPGQKNNNNQTIIEDNVILFTKSIIFPGVRVGKNSIIGACSVVTKDVPPNVIALGNPARVILVNRIFNRKFV